MFRAGSLGIEENNLVESGRVCCAQIKIRAKLPNE
jgi:hypothetical protein